MTLAETHFARKNNFVNQRTIPNFLESTNIAFTIVPLFRESEKEDTSERGYLRHGGVTTVMAVVSIYYVGR